MGESCKGGDSTKSTGGAAISITQRWKSGYLKAGESSMSQQHKHGALRQLCAQAERKLTIAFKGEMEI